MHPGLGNRGDACAHRSDDSRQGFVTMSASMLVADPVAPSSAAAFTHLTGVAVFLYLYTYSLSFRVLFRTRTLAK
jgi:hypothetical protein